ncbi:J domain-containing protein [Acidithiobacillus ferrivorans]|nr:J domain-containing protein [Acidithiobacillus ferrivorans]
MDVIEAAGYLGTSASADDAGIKRSWREAASRWHPDRGGDHEAMQTINAARDLLLSMTREARRAEKKRLAPKLDAIIDKIWAEMDTWDARVAATAAAKTPPPEPIPTPKTTKRRAAQWEARNADKVRLQTTARVKAHRSKNPEEYRSYMREYMKNRRAKP